MVTTGTENKYCRENDECFHSFTVILAFSGEGCEAVVIGELGIFHGFLQVMIVLPVPHQDGVKHGQRCNQGT